MKKYFAIFGFVMFFSLFLVASQASAAITVNGTITNIRQDNTFDLRTATNTYSVIILPTTKIKDSNSDITIADLNNGMTVSVAGDNSNLQIRAWTIFTTTRILTGSVNGFQATPPEDIINAAYFDLVNGTTRTFVIIPRNAKLADSNGPIKLEDISNGMTLSVKGSGSANVFFRVEAVTVTSQSIL